MQTKIHISNSFLATFLVVIGFTVYMFSFNNGLFWDDDDFILKNIYIQDWKYLPQLFSENVIAGSGLLSNYWRPVLLMVFSVEWHLWGAWAPGWHMVNTLFHVGNGVMLFFILTRLTSVIPEATSSTEGCPESTSGQRWILKQVQDDKRRWLAFLVTLLFLIHPVQVEAVAYANSLGDSLSVFFMFLGILCFQQYLQLVSCRATTRHPELQNLDSDSQLRQGYVGQAGDGMTFKIYLWLTTSILTYPLALMSKETAIVMPALLALIALLDYRLHKSNRTNMTYRTYIIPIVAFGVIAITYLALRATSLNFKNSFNLYDESNVFTDSLWVRLLTFCKIIVEYIKLIFWPQDLYMERSLEFATSLWDWQVLLGALIIISLLIIAWRSWRKNPLIAFGILWFFIALAPTSNILVPINGLLYEHWLYVPVIGIAVACSVPIYEMLSFRKPPVAPRAVRNPEIQESRFRLGDRNDNIIQPINRHATVIVIVMVIVLTALAARSILRIRDWSDPITFYKQTIQYAPSSYRINNNLGMVLADTGQYKEAAEYYKAAIDLDKNNPVAYHNSANLFAAAGNLSLAAKYYEKAVELDPKFLYSYPKLINTYYALKNYNQAMASIDKYMAQVGKQPELVKLRQQIEQEQLQFLLGSMHPEN